MQIKLNQLVGWLGELLTEWRVPGMAVVHAGQVIDLKGSGLRDVEKGLAVTQHTRFAIGSTTKAFATMAMTMLVDEGILDWDTLVRLYMPSFNLWDSFTSERITPRDLVTHRSRPPRHDNLWRFSNCILAELVQKLQYLEPSYDLRATYQHNNPVYVVAGFLAEYLWG